MRVTKEKAYNLYKPTLMQTFLRTAYHSLVFFNVLVSFLEALGENFFFNLLLLILLYAIFDFLREFFPSWPPALCLKRFFLTSRKSSNWKPVAGPIKSDICAITGNYYYNNNSLIKVSAGCKHT